MSAPDWVTLMAPEITLRLPQTHSMEIVLAFCLALAPTGTAGADRDAQPSLCGRGVTQHDQGARGVEEAVKHSGGFSWVLHIFYTF
jgi:hypothetical protein